MNMSTYRFDRRRQLIVYGFFIEEGAEGWSLVDLTPLGRHDEHEGSAA